ncbi:MAG: sigma 54-interacting transcriptional regulator [Labilithrix sp.]
MDAPPDATVPVERSANPVSVRRFWLTVLVGPDAGKKHASNGDRVVVGTHESADFIVADETVSRFHVEITVDGDRAIVRDLGSRNGTIVDGVGIREAYLRDGAMITVGRSQVRFELRPDEVKMALSERARFGTMVGTSIPMRRAFSLLERAAASNAAVLLEGETGTGKEAAAESIHSESARKSGPFIVVDCGAIPPDLLEAELFGHEKGSFTGAHTAREGAFEAADGGTIFLDEIGELSPDLQPKLLRVLEKKQIKRIGTATFKTVDVRVIAATNRNLREEVNAKRFRSDLYYRLAVIEVHLPALRERREDLPLLVGKLLDGLGPEAETAAMRTPESLADIARHHFPGNVRELRNYLERCLALKERVPLEGDGSGAGTDNELAPAYDQPLRVARERWTRAFERRYLEELLRRHDDNVSAAARAAAVDRMHFYRLLWRHGLR